MSLVSDTIKISAYAKVNLALAVGAIDSSSRMHPICSWMHAIDLYDQITIRRSRNQPGSSYRIGWANSQGHDFDVEWAIKDDLAVRAHRAVEQYTGLDLPVSIDVSKAIPAGGGLGGGSSDAAAVLVGLNELFELGLSQEQLVAIARTLGSDVPFFIDLGHEVPRPAIVEGFGDQITRLERVHKGTPITLFIPGFGCATGAVYGVFDRLIQGHGHQIDRERVLGLASQTTIDSHGLMNDLAQPAVEVSPELGSLIQLLTREVDEPIRVSGSGSTLFVVGSVDEGLCAGCSVKPTSLC